jgi:hypothetical protein
VVKKVHKSGKADVDPIRGLDASPVGDKTLVVEYEPDSELRDTEQVPLLEEGGVEAFIRREVLPHAPDAWFVESSIVTSNGRLHPKAAYLRIGPAPFWASNLLLGECTQALSILSTSPVSTIFLGDTL